MRALLFPLLCLLPVLAGCAGGAEPCRPEKLAELPLHVVNKVPVVTAEINGRPAELVLDTGSDRSVLSRGAARRLGVAEQGAAPELRAAGGVAAASRGVAESVVLGGLRLMRVPVLLADRPDPPLDGLLGIDVMVDYEVELDVAGRRAVFYRARSCATGRPDWAGEVVELAAQQQAGSGHLFVPVTVDGEPLRGLLDSGASRSTLSLQAAEDAGLRGRALQRLPRFRGEAVNAEGIVFRERQFRTLQIGPDVVERPELTVTDLPAFAGDLLVGEDFIGTRRLWFWFRLGRVFVLKG